MGNGDRFQKGAKMPTCFEIRRLRHGYEWRDMFENQRGYRYAVDVLKIPPPCIEMIRCDPDAGTLEIRLKKDHLGHGSPWFFRLLQTHSYVRTETDRMMIY
jgi:hypothetical protein